MNSNLNALVKRIACGFVCPALLVLLGGGIGFSQTTSELLLPLSKPPQSKSKATDAGGVRETAGVKFCLYQEKYVRGVTHPKGIQLTEAGPLSYVLLEPTFTLTKKHVKKCEWKETRQPAISDLDYRTLYIEFSDRGRAEMFEAFKEIKPASFVMVLDDRPFPIRISFRAGSIKETSEKLSLGYFVDHDFCQAFVDVLNPTGVPSPRERLKRLYFPTLVGTKRVMRSTSEKDGVREITETMTSVEEADGKYIVTLRRESPEGNVGDQAEQKYGVSSRGVVAHSTTNDARLANPEPLLKLPARVADMWTHKELDADQGLTKTGDFTVWGQEVVEVPGGSFKAIPVHQRHAWSRDGRQVKRWTSTTWYALGVGVVKRVSDEDGATSVSELIEFTRGDVN